MTYRVLAVAVFSASCLAAPLVVAHAEWMPRQDVDRAVYFPTTVGAKWVYRESDRPDQRHVVFVSEAVTLTDGVPVVTVRQEGRPSYFWKTAVSDRGLVFVTNGGRPSGPNGTCLRLPGKVGDTWSDEPADGVRAEYTLLGVRRITVPAGTYDAVGVTCCLYWPNGMCRDSVSTRWYAPDVGLIKQKWEFAETVLVSFTLPMATSP